MTFPKAFKLNKLIRCVSFFIFLTTKIFFRFMKNLVILMQTFKIINLYHFLKAKRLMDAGI